MEEVKVNNPNQFSVHHIQELTESKKDPFTQARIEPTTSKNTRVITPNIPGLRT
jgi:hypothetical protein